MAPERLSEELVAAGAALLETTDTLGMQAQGAMWLYSDLLQDWRYYLVTSVVDTLGRRRTYKLLLDAFEKVAFPKSMTPEDVHLGSPNDPVFRAISSAVSVGPQARVVFDNVTIDGVRFDGVVYRSVKEPPDFVEAERIEKKFSKRVRDIVSA